MFSNVSKKPAKIAMFLKDKVDGDITQKALDFVNKSGH